MWLLGVICLLTLVPQIAMSRPAFLRAETTDSPEDANFRKVLSQQLRKPNVHVPVFLKMPRTAELLEVHARLDWPRTGHACSAALAQAGGASQNRPPFPGFLRALLTLSAIADNQLSVTEREMACLVRELLRTEAHPCHHEHFSCVVIAVPDRGMLVGCMSNVDDVITMPPEVVGNVVTPGFLDLQVPLAFKLNRTCNKDPGTLQPICRRVNLMSGQVSILEDFSCCCTETTCVHFFADQHGLNPLPFLHLELGDVNTSLVPVPTGVPVVQQRGTAQPDVAVGAFDWGFSPFEIISVVVALGVLVLLAIIIGLWCLREREQGSRVARKARQEKAASGIGNDLDDDILPVNYKHRGPRVQ